MPCCIVLLHLMLYRWGPVFSPVWMQEKLMFEFGRSLWQKSSPVSCRELQMLPLTRTNFGAGLWVASMQGVPQCDSMDGPCRIVLFCCT